MWSLFGMVFIQRRGRYMVESIRLKLGCYSEVGRYSEGCDWEEALISTITTPHLAGKMRSLFRIVFSFSPGLVTRNLLF